MAAIKRVQVFPSAGIPHATTQFHSYDSDITRILMRSETLSLLMVQNGICHRPEVLAHLPRRCVFFRRLQPNQSSPSMGHENDA